MASAASARAVTAAADRFSRLSAGARLIILLSLALLPLGALAVIASVQAARSADLERRASVRVVASESARRLASEISVDSTALRSAANLLERGEDPASICARTQSVIATSFGEPTRFALVSRTGRPVCGSAEAVRAFAGADLRADSSARLDRDGLTIVLPGDTRSFVGVARYPRDQLARIVRPLGFMLPFSLALGDEGQSLAMVEDFRPRALERQEMVSIAVPNTPLTLMLAVRSAPYRPAEILSASVPIIMWLVAVLVAWIVINRLVIHPLAQLRANVSNYQPGEILQPLHRMTVPAREIEELADTFRAISQTVATHEAELERGLARQTRLTREVHHRVKNNLQVVSSLINLHARAAKSPEASAAYASIGRRVDALAVVHRNHYAELEENRGVNLRSLIGELSANLRATASGDAARLAILIDVPSVYVNQDTAIPLAFLATELVELAMAIDPRAAIRVMVPPLEDADRACLVVASPALGDSEKLQDLVAGRYGRVMEGLSRQLRSPLERDANSGTYQICFPLVLDAAGER
jgi:two-component system, sensor histidine kinase PdtaS